MAVNGERAKNDGGLELGHAEENRDLFLGFYIWTIPSNNIRIAP